MGGSFHSYVKLLEDTNQIHPVFPSPLDPPAAAPCRWRRTAAPRACPSGSPWPHPPGGSAPRGRPGRSPRHLETAKNRGFLAISMGKWWKNGGNMVETWRENDEKGQTPLEVAEKIRWTQGIIGNMSISVSSDTYSKGNLDPTWQLESNKP